MKRVYCIGELLIDFVSENGNEYSRKPGGAPANVAATVSKLGGTSYFLGQVGKDSLGNFLKDVLEENKINTEHLKMEGKTTLVLVTLDKSGERSFEFYRGSDGMYEIDLSQLQIQKEDVIHFGSATAFLPGKLRESYYKLLQEAKEKGAMISFDPNYRNALITSEILPQYKEDCWNFMKNADFIKISDEEAMLLTEKKSLKEAIEVFNDKKLSTIAITLGKEGTLVIEKGVEKRISSIKINQKDSTGAGDAFVGGVLYKLAAEDRINYEEFVFFANAVGAITCENYGAIPAIPTMEEVKKRM